ncbi:MAG: spermidine synthase [Pseudomonadales bacterium]|jgi:spermidine synthase
MNQRRYFIPFWLSLFVGFSSLSIEVLWIRVVSFSIHTVPQAFSYVLILFLAGIAVGSYIGKRMCEAPNRDLYGVSAVVLILAALVDFSSLRLINFEDRMLNIALYSLLIFVTAMLKSIVFPIAHHLGSNQSKKIAASVSYVYFGNILGATLGPLVTTFVLLRMLTTAQSFMAVSIVTLATALLAVLCSDRKLAILKFSSAPALIAAIIFINLTDDKLWYRLIDVGRTHSEQPHGQFRDNFESQYGVINIDANDTGDIVFGFGKYDGRLNTSLMRNSNEIDRAYRIAGFHTTPKRVLIIGFSTGSWANVISWLPRVEEMDIVEINPDYMKIASDRPEVSAILDNNKVNYHIDDGRRWLKRNPHLRFDLIVMNSSYHFRNSVTHVLSKEMFELVQSRLNKRGVFYFNTTGSPDAFRTAAEVFSVTSSYKYFVAASNSPFVLDRATTLMRLASMKDGSELVFGNSPAELETFDKMLDIDMVEFPLVASSLPRKTHTITDNTPVTEYQYGWLAGKLGLIDPEPWQASWPQSGK